MSMRIENLSFTYSAGTAFEGQALKGISLEIPDDQFIGIIGHTGSGKSTLIQHLNGLLRADSGAVYDWQGRNIYNEGYPMKELRSRVGLVFQYPEHQLFEIDVITDVQFGPKNQGLLADEARERAENALKAVGLDETYYERSPFEMSGGQKRRVAIAGTLAMEPDLLILDEPTAGLDPKGKEEILELIKKIHEERHISVILVSHSMEDIARYCERIIVLNQGEVMYDDTPRNVFSHKKELEQMGLGVPEVTRIAGTLKEAGFDIPDGITTIEEAREVLLKYV